MNVLQAVLDYETPSTWEVKSADEYSNSFLLFDIKVFENEWEQAVGHSQLDTDVLSLQRVQNPFQLGLFRIQEEKRRKEGESCQKVSWYIYKRNLNYLIVYS